MNLLRRSLPFVLVVALVGGVTYVAWAHPGHAGHESQEVDPLEAANRPASKPGVTSGGASGLSRYEVLAAGLTVFVLAIFVGFEVISKVPPTLHTPLMSGSNAISGITVVGAILAAGRSQFDFVTALAVVAVALAMINVVGGFVVTDRILRMFKRR